MPCLLPLKIVLFTLLIPGAVTVYIPLRLLSPPVITPLSLLHLPALLAMLCGALIYLRCAWDFAIQGKGTPAPLDPPKHLVIAGLYRRTRNPMYQGVILLLLAECVYFGDTTLLLYAGTVALVFHLFVVFYEEPALLRRFGTDYSGYCRHVPRWGFAWQAFTARD